MFRILYELDRLLWEDPDQDQLDVWTVALQAESKSQPDEYSIAWDTVATAILYGLDPERAARVGQSPFEVADAHSADLAYYYEHVFDANGEMLPDVLERFEWPPHRALFLHDVQVPEQLRRRGYASVLVADAILTLATAGTAVFAHPGPTEPEVAEQGEIAQLRAETVNTRFLGALGFSPFRDRLWTLDLATETGVESLAATRRNVRPA